MWTATIRRGRGAAAPCARRLWSTSICSGGSCRGALRAIGCWVSAICRRGASGRVTGPTCRRLVSVGRLGAESGVAGLSLIVLGRSGLLGASARPTCATGRATPPTEGAKFILVIATAPFAANPVSTFAFPSDAVAPFALATYAITFFMLTTSSVATPFAACSFAACSFATGPFATGPFATGPFVPSASARGVGNRGDKAQRQDRSSCERLVGAW